MSRRTDLEDQYTERFGQGPPLIMFEDEDELVEAVEEALETDIPIDPGGRLPEEVRQGNAVV